MRMILFASAMYFVAFGQAALGQVAANEPVPIGDRSRWVQSADWPAALIRQEIEGSVKTELTVGVTGEVLGCKIVQSSGYDAMDNIACTRLRQRGQFEPARDAQGVAVEATYPMTIAFQFNDRLTKIPAAGSAKMIMVVGADGTVLECRQEVSLLDAPVQERACPTGIVFEPFLDDNGNAVSVRVISERSTRVEVLTD